MWAYLGWDVEARDAAKARFAGAAYCSVQSKVQETAVRLLRPYIDAVGRLSVRQPDTVGWLASKFASRSVWQTKCFQRLVMTRVGLDLLSPAAAWNGCLAVDDAWIFDAVRAGGVAPSRVLWIGRASRRRLRLRQIVLGPLKRLAWMVYTLVFRLFVWLVFRSYRRDTERPPTADVALYAYLEERTIGRDGTYCDAHLGNLGQIAERAGLSTVRFTQLVYPARLTFRAARNCSVWPLVLSVSAGDIVRATVARWRPKGLDEIDIPGIPRAALEVLLEPERLAEAGAGHMSHRLTYAALARYFDGRPAATIVYTFENQPWEKLMCWAASRSAVPPRIVGFQQSTVARMFVNFFRSRFEDKRFFPETILVTGERFARLLTDGGWDEDSLTICGALRHADVLRWNAPRIEPVEDAGRAVVVSLPVDLDLSREMLTALRRDFPDGGTADGIRFLVRFHPAGGWKVVRRFRDWLAHVSIDRQPFLQTLRTEHVACVLTAMGAPALEALFCGFPVLRFRTELGIEIDPLDDYQGDGLWVVDGRSLRRTLLELLEGSQPSSERASRTRATLASYFAAPEPGAVASVLSPRTAGATV